MKKLFLLLFIISFIALPFLLLAANQDAIGGLDKTAGTEGAGLVKIDVAVFVGNIIRAVLALLGVIVLVLMVYGGYLWMMSGGNDQMVKKAKDILINATIGLIIVLAAYAITTFVVRGIYSAINSSGQDSQCSNGTTYKCVNKVDQQSCAEDSSPDCVCSCRK